MPTIQINDIAMYYEIHGESEPLALILQGRRDQLSPFALAEELRDGIPGARLVAFDGSHLFMLMRERQRFLDTALDFLGE